jgi:hypothetical protein
VKIRHLFLLLVVFLGLFLACGEKGPPVPPEIEPLPVVQDLSKSLTGDFLTLTWSVPGRQGKTFKNPAGFKVFRARKSVIDSACKDCPDHYKLLADMPVLGRIKNNRVTYQEILEPGYLYKFKVRLYTDRGAESRDSNIVEVLRE